MVCSNPCSPTLLASQAVTKGQAEWLLVCSTRSQDISFGQATTWLLCPFYVPLTKTLKTNAIHKSPRKTYKTLISTHITPRPLGDPSAVVS